MTTLAALEHQWTESCAKLDEAQEMVRRLTVQHSSLGARLARARQAARRKQIDPCQSTGPTCQSDQEAGSVTERSPT